jgi:hypothetical protein
MDLLIFIKHFVAKAVMNFVLISISLLLIIKLFVTKAFMNLFKILFDLLIFIKHFVAKVVMNFLFISINLLLIIKLFVTKVVMNFFNILLDLLIFIKHFVAKVIINFVLISINLLLIIKLFVTKAFIDLFKILFNLLIFIKNFVAKVVMNFFKILLDLLIHLKVFVAKLVLTFVEITMSLCSKVVINLLIMSTKMWKFWSLNKLLGLMAFLILFYQIISVTISYSQFETVIDMKATSDLKHEPTITLCLKNDFEFSQRPQNVRHIEKVFHNPIICISKEYNGYTNCSKLTKIVESVTTLSQRCRSYFSQIFDNKSKDGFLSFLIDNNINVFSLIHQKKTPPHFARQKIEIRKSSINGIDYTRIVTKLLPFPYSTDCYDYENEENPVLNYKSREDCIVKHLEKKEFNECGCNKRWFYGYSRPQNLSNICLKSIECKFNAKSEMKSLNQICKNNCFNEYYMNVFDTQQIVKSLLVFNVSYLLPATTQKHEILFTYLPKMNLIEYLCSIGSLISMWFGFSVYDLVLIFAKESKRILLLLVSMKCRSFITAIVKFKEIISKVNEIFSSITIIVFSALMLIQIIAIISSYFDFETVTRFDVQQTKLIPNVMFGFAQIPNNLNKLYEIYPQMKQEIDKINESKDIKEYDSYAKQINYSKITKIYDKYMLRLLIDNRLNDFHRISQTNNCIKSCQIKFFDNLELKNCTSEFGINNIDLGMIVMMKRFDFSKLDKNKVEKITFQLDSSQDLEFALFYLAFNQIISRSFVLITPNAKTTATFSTFLTNKLRSNEINCIFEENQKDFSEDYFDFCRYDCIVDKVNQSCGCVPVYHVPFFFNKNFLKNNYKFCENCSVSLDKSKVSSIKDQCQEICKPLCNSLNFETKTQVSKHVSNKAILEIIPMKTPRIAYTETLKTDFDRLIYNCGGILGLWFGITPIKAVDLIQYIPKIYKNLINICATVFQFLITFWIRIKQNRED